MNRKTQMILGIGFPLLLIIVFLINVFVPDKGFSDEENRVLESFPHFSISSYKDGRFESKLEDYANDQFVGRNNLIKVKTAFDRTIGKRFSNGVYLGKDSYLMEDLTVPDRKRLEKNLGALKKFKKEYPDVTMTFLLAPNAANIMADKMPALAVPGDQDKYMDQYFKELQEMGYTTVDVRPAFRKNKDKTQLYYKTDHHWTSMGAYIAYKEFANTMGLDIPVKYKPYVVKNDFRGTLASKSGFTNGEDDSMTLYLPEEGSDYKNSIIYYFDSKEKTTQFYQLDKLKLKDAYTVFGGSNHPIYTITTPVKSKKNLLLVKDSYANSMVPFLSQNYKTIVVVDPRYFYDDIHSIMSTYQITDVLFLYNANTYFNDDSLEMMMN